jgi:hypothetical protein
VTAPTADHEQRAFDLLRRPDWPTTLTELRTAERQAALVRGLAQRLANGQGMARHDDAPAPLPEVPLRSCDFPPRLNGTRATGQTERRRRDVGAIDLKRLAAGERADD